MSPSYNNAWKLLALAEGNTIPPEYFRKPKNPCHKANFGEVQGFLGFLKYSGGIV
jgi:hypothetical protein